ncbi:MAG: Ribosome hibernation promoting factor [Phycisphaerae bacterium]|nr:Ribosome hibernation promoting factor [Phycisphaerae bacterium]
MQVVITAQRINLTQESKETIEEKAGRLTRYYDRIQEIEVIVDRTDTTFDVEILVNAERNVELVATASEETLRSALDAAVHKMERQLTDHKEKFRNRKHPAQ